MQCPSCKSYQLHPTKIEAGLPGRECKKCGGLLIDLLSYRAWAEGAASAVRPCSKEKLVEVEDTSKALACPKCAKLMLKFRVLGDIKNKIDVCSVCDEAWLDHGEWELLGALSLQDKMTKIFTDPWQINIKKHESEVAHQQRFQEVLGKEEFERLSETKRWIDGHPQKDDLIRYLLRK